MSEPMPPESWWVRAPGFCYGPFDTLGEAQLCRDDYGRSGLTVGIEELRDDGIAYPDCECGDSEGVHSPDGGSCGDCDECSRYMPADGEVV